SIHSTTPSFKTIATCYPYESAMGKGRGILFRVKVLGSTGFVIDSLYVRSQPLPFIAKKIKGGWTLEANHRKASAEPSISQDGKLNKPKETADPLFARQ